MTLAPNTPITQENAVLYERAVMFATRDKPSVSYIQRRLEISYAEAAVLIRRMQRDGLISEPSPLGKREILVPYTDRPALSPPAEGGWSDIETAPTDGKKTEYRAADGSTTEAYANPEFRPQSRALYTHWRRTPTPPSVDWERVGPKLVEALVAIKAGGSWQGDTASDALAATQPQSNGD